MFDRDRGEPPLTALRAFEAVARLGSATAAARELRVSPSAISHQLAQLEDFLRQPLTLRQGRGLTLTDAGREYFRAVRAAFSVLRGATDQLLEGTGSTQVRLAVIPLFARGWLFRHLHEFKLANPDIDLTISYAHHRNYVSDSADLSVRFGEGAWKGYEAHRILRGVIAPFCSRDYLMRNPGCGDGADRLAAGSLIHDQDRNGWTNWFASHGVASPPLGGLLVEDGNLAVQAALESLGVALLRPSLIGALVEDGRLVRLAPDDLDDGRDYYLCHLVAQPLSNAERRLLGWIIDRCRGPA